MKQKTKKLEQKSCMFQKMVRMLIQNFFAHNVGKNAAALAYYLLFALFPLLIFLSNLLGLLRLDIMAVTEVLGRFLPQDIVELIETYLDYISNTSSHTLLWFSLIFSIWFPMRAIKGLMDDVRLAYHLGKPKSPVIYRIHQFIYTIVFLLVLSFTLFLSTLGEHVLIYVTNKLPQGTIPISGYLLRLWQYLRFVPMGLLMLAALGALYWLSLDKRQPVKTVFPGLVMALVLWLLVSIGFSFYVENFANYSIIYGTLGAVIVLLLWLYMTAIILIFGAEFNAVFVTLRVGK